MRSRLALPLVILIGAAAPLSAQAGQGTYMTVPVASDTMAMPDGSMQLLGHYEQIVLANTPTHLMNDTKGKCVGLFRVVDGKPASASGICFTQAKDGHGYTLWWEMTEGGTTACPDLCGKWGVYGGYGRFAGVSGGGTWKRNGQFVDGSSSGTWTGTITKM